MPPVATDGGVQVIAGPFDGTAVKDNVMVDGRPGTAFVVAESARSLFFRLKDGTPAGMHRVTLREGLGEFNFTLCVLNLSLSADQLSLLRGQSTRFRAVISGPETLPASAWRESSVPSELVDVASLQKLAPEFRAPKAGESGSILFVIENKSRDTVTIGQEVIVLRLNEQDFRNGPYRYEGRITARKSGGFKIDGSVVAFLTPVVFEKEIQQ